MQANVRIDITCQGIKTVLQEFWNIPKQRNDADPCQHASGQLLSAALVVFINPPFTAPFTAHCPLDTAAAEVGVNKVLHRCLRTVAGLFGQTLT